MQNFLATVRSKAYNVLSELRKSSRNVDDFINILTIPYSLDVFENKALTKLDELCYYTGMDFHDTMKQMYNTFNTHADNLITGTINDEVIQLKMTFSDGSDALHDVWDISWRILGSVEETTSSWGSVMSHTLNNANITVNEAMGSLFKEDNLVKMLQQAVESSSINQTIEQALEAAIDNYSASRNDARHYADVANQFYIDNCNKIQNRFPDLESICDILKQGLAGGLPSTLSAIGQIWKSLQNLHDDGEDYTVFVDNSAYGIKAFTIGFVDVALSAVQIIGTVLAIVGNMVLRIVGIITSAIATVISKVREFIKNTFDPATLAGISDAEDYGTTEFPYGYWQTEISGQAYDMLFNSSSSCYLGNKIVTQLKEQGGLTLQVPGGSYNLYLNPNKDQCLDIIIRLSTCVTMSFFDAINNCSYVSVSFSNEDMYDLENNHLTINVTNTSKRLILSDVYEEYYKHISNPIVEQDVSAEDFDALLRKRFWNAQSWIYGFNMILHTMRPTWSTNQWTEVYPTCLDTKDNEPWLSNFSSSYLLMIASNYWWNKFINYASSVVGPKNWTYVYKDGSPTSGSTASLNFMIQIIPSVATWLFPDQQELTSGSSQDFTLASIFDPDLFSWIYYYGYDNTPYNVSLPHNESDSIMLLDTFHGFGVEMIRVPSYDRVATMHTVIVAITLTVVAVAVTVATTIIVKRQVKQKRQLLAANAEAAWQRVVEDGPTTENLRAYNKAIRKNNKFVSLFGGTKYSKQGFWGSDSASVTESVLANQDILNKITSKQSSDVITDVIEVKHLIQG